MNPDFIFILTGIFSALLTFILGRWFHGTLGESQKKIDKLEYHVDHLGRQIRMSDGNMTPRQYGATRVRSNEVVVPYAAIIKCDHCGGYKPWDHKCKSCGA